MIQGSKTAPSHSHKIESITCLPCLSCHLRHPNRPESIERGIDRSRDWRPLLDGCVGWPLSLKDGDGARWRQRQQAKQGVVSCPSHLNRQTIHLINDTDRQAGSVGRPGLGVE